MPNSVNQGALAAVIKTAAFKQTSAGWNEIIYTTEDEHNFVAGQSVTVVGITGGTSANVSGHMIINVPSVKSFIVSSSSAYVTSTTPTVGTGASAVTAFTTNSWANLFNVKYASPEPATTAPFYMDIIPNIQAFAASYPTNGTVSALVEWNAIGGSNPLATITLTQTLGTTTTTVITSAAGVGSTTVTGLTADTIYTFGITASNSFSTKTSTVEISVPRYISEMGSVTSSATASTANSVTTVWVSPTIASPSVITYELQRAQSADNSTWSSWTTVSTSISGTTTSYVDGGLSNTTHYKYRVRAFNGTYTGYVEGASVLPFELTDPMNVPVVSYDPSGTKSLLIGAPVTFINNPAITSWTIQRSTTGTNGWGATATTPTLPYTDSSVGLNTTYYYRIKATNGELTSAYSAATAGNLTYNVPNAPTGVSAAPSGSASDVITVSWSAATVAAGSPAVSNYMLERSLDDSSWTTVTSAISASATSYNDSGRTLGQIYYYRVSAINSVGTGAASSSANATIVLIPGTASVSVASTTIYDTDATVTVTTGASRSVTLQYSTDNSTWYDYQTTSANGSGNAVFYFHISVGTDSYTYFRAQVAQDAVYLPTTSSAVSTKTVNNGLTRTATYAGWYSPNGSYLTQIRVTDIQGWGVSGVTVSWYVKRYGNAWGEWYSNTTDSNGYANYFWTSGESRAIAAYVSKSNYSAGGSTTTSIHTEYIQEYASGTQTDYGSWCEANSWGTRIGGAGGYMYSGWWSTSQGRQVSAAAFTTGFSWGRINDGTIDDVQIDITRKGGTGGTGMNIAYGVIYDTTCPSSLNSQNYTSIIMWGATNRPAYSSSNNRDYGTSLAPMKNYFGKNYGAKGLLFGYKSEAATQDNYAVINNNVTLYIWYKADPFA